MNAPKLTFGDFVLDVAGYELSRGGRSIRLERIPMELLLLLVDRRGQLVAREEILQKLWGKDVFLDVDNSINTAISKIRVALRDDPEKPTFIKTVAGKGYRFIAPITALPEGTGASIQGPAVARGGEGSAGLPGGAVEGKPVAGAGVEIGSAAQIDSKSRTRARRLWLWASITGIAFAAGLAGWAWRDSLRRIVSPSAPPVIRSLAVLPLENLTGDASQEYFADGMTDALITDLSQIGTLRVISRTSVMRYKGARKALPGIARELGVDGIVEGTVARSGNRVRITSQLIYGPSDQHLWARTYERDLSDVLKLQGEVAQAIAGEVRAAVTPEQRARFSATATVNPRVYEAYLKGRYFWNKRTQEGLRRAMEYFQQAVDENPAYAPAYAGLADTYFPLTNWGWIYIEEAIPKAKAAALKAVELDERLAEAHVSLGMVRFVYDWDWPEAGKHFERALALNPAYPPAHVWYSDYLMTLGRSGESLAEMKRAVDLDPVSPELSHHMAWQLSMVGRYDEAIEQERKTVEMDPSFPPAHAVLAGAYAAKSMYREALAEVEKLSPLSPGSPAAIVALASIHARSGERSRALRELEELKAFSKRGHVQPYDFALVYLRLGDKNQAFRWLEKAYQERSPYLPWLKVNAAWAPMRSDPRFSDLLRRLGLPE